MVLDVKYWYSDSLHPENVKFPHYILLDGGNAEGVLKSLQMVAEPTDVVSAWLNENVGINNWKNLYGTLLFTEKEFAMAFILKWS